MPPQIAPLNRLATLLPETGNIGVAVLIPWTVFLIEMDAKGRFVHIDTLAATGEIASDESILFAGNDN